MKLATAQIAGFLASPPDAVRVILLYGPDAGLVRERADALAKKTVPDLADPFRVALLTGAAVNEDPARLYDEVAAQALGGGRRLIRVQQALDTNATALGKLLADMPSGDSLVIMEGGELEKRSKLRALCEGADPHAAGIPCYVEDSAQRQRTIVDILKAEGLTAPRDVVQLLDDTLPPDRIAMRSELEKLALYKMGVGDRGAGVKKESPTPNPQPPTPNTVTLDDIHAVLHDAGAAALDDLVLATASGEAGRVVTLLEHLFAEQTAPVAVLRAAQRHFLRLQLARAAMDDLGLSAGEAIKRLQPPVFWKSVAPMTQQTQRWPVAQIEKLLEKLYDAEAAVKRTGTPDAALCAQLLLQAAGRR